MAIKPWQYVFRRVAEIHAFQDGFTVFALLGLLGTAPELALVFAVLLGIDATKPRRILRRLDDLVRTAEIQENPEYALVGGLLGAAVGVGAGRVLGPYLAAVDVMALLGV